MHTGNSSHERVGHRHHAGMNVACGPTPSTGTSASRSLHRYVLVLITLAATTFMTLQATAAVTWQQHQVRQMVIDEARRQGFPEALALAVAEVESGFDPRAVSSAGAIGVMQIMPATAEQELGVSRYALKHPQTNIRAGIRFLGDLIEQYDGRWDIALSHYNGGSAVRSADGELRVIPATRRYVNKVLSASRDYEFTSSRGYASSTLDDFSGPGDITMSPRREYISQARTGIIAELDRLIERNERRGATLAHHVW